MTEVERIYRELDELAAKWRNQSTISSRAWHMARIDAWLDKLIQVRRNE